MAFRLAIQGKAWFYIRHPRTDEADVDLRQMRYFVAIVDEGAFSRAAASLGVAQPALSLHVRKMEEELGTTLLLRTAGGVTPTEAGLHLAARARGLLAEMRSLEEELRGLGDQPSGVVRIGLPGTISVILSVPLIAKARAQYPRVKIVVAEAMSGFVRDWLGEGRIELGVLYGEIGEPGLRSSPLLEEELVLLAPPGTTTDEAGLAILADNPLILPSEAHGLRRMIEQSLRAEDLRVDPAIEIDSYPCIKRLVADGYGCSVLPWHAVAEEAAKGLVSVRRFARPRLWRRANLAWNAARPLGQAAQCVQDLLRAEVGQLIATGVWVGARGPDIQRTGPVAKSRYG